MRCRQTDFLLLAIEQTKPPPLGDGQTLEVSIDFMVDDLTETVAHFKERQVEFVSGWVANEKRVFIQNPDGLVFEVIQR